MVMFHYGSLSWTSGTLSGGDPSSGLGGNAALVSQYAFIIIIITITIMIRC